MKRLHRLPARIIRSTNVLICFALILSVIAGVVPFQTASSKESIRLRQQGNGQGNNGRERRVNPPAPRTGPPAANLPNLNEVQHRRVEAPRAPNTLPSLMRSRRKPLESRNGRRVGDAPLPVPTPRALPAPSVLPTPLHDELATDSTGSRVLLASNFAFSSLPFQLRGYRALRFDQLDTLSDSPIRLWPESTAVASRTFDLATAPIPQAVGAKIVFVSSRDGFMQIYVMNSDGTGQARLTTDASNNENPRWSPDGAKILFQSDRDNPGSGLRDIYVMNADGNGQIRLTTDMNDDCNATWSADGSKIVFQSFRNGLSYQIYAMNADGSGQINISNSASNDTQPSWSSDNAKIAFASDRDQPGFPNIYVMNSNGSNQIRLTWSSTGCWDEQPIWSPDRTKIVFTSTRDSATETWQETDDDGNVLTKSKLKINKEVYVMTANGISQTRLTNDLSNDDSACWSTDGTRIVFRSERERVEFDPIPQIWTMNSDGTNQTNLSNSGAGDFSPSWSSSYNQSPVANAGGPYNGIVSQTVTFNAGGSFDPDGTVTGYSWTFGDGGSGTGATPTHSYASAGTYAATVTITDNFGATNSATANVTVSASVADQYTQNFYQWALLRSSNAEETNYWMDMFRAAYAHGQGSMTLAVREMGKTIFESAEYAARNRSDHWYVYDLYRTYLMREPDSQGWAYWDAAVPVYGRDHVRRGFDESTEFQNLVATIIPTGSPSAAVTSLAAARVDPFNQSGNQLQARDAEWSVSLLSLPGRAGLDLGLGLSYSSSVWTHSGPYNYFDEENGSPSPGFKIGFPTVQEKYFDAQVGANVYLLTTATGRKVELRQVGTSDVYESADSSYLQVNL
jgi:Tol biopolymer transport system component